jgi:hypothetical protein
MSCRGIIARKTKDGWRGVYNHSDSQPTVLGAALLETIDDAINENDTKASQYDKVTRFCDEYIDKHPVGWNQFPTAPYDDGPVILQEYINGDFKGSWDTEWCYVIDPLALTLTVYKVLWEWLEEDIERINPSDFPPPDKLREHTRFDIRAEISLIGSGVDFEAIEE